MLVAGLTLAYGSEGGWLGEGAAGAGDGGPVGGEPNRLGRLPGGVPV